MPRGRLGRRWLSSAALAVAIVLFVATPALAVESAADLPPDANPLATLMVVAIAVALVSAWSAYRDRRTRRP